MIGVLVSARLELFLLSSCYRAVFWIWNENCAGNTLMFWFFVKSSLSIAKDIFSLPPCSASDEVHKRTGREHSQDR